jgi:hypothetical protein
MLTGLLAADGGYLEVVATAGVSLAEALPEAGAGSNAT